MAHPAETIVHVGLSARYRLGALGIEMDLLVEVIRRGEAARAQATGFDPANAAGWDAYRYRVRAMREVFCPLGWAKKSSKNLELIVSPDERLTIFTKSGSADVGLTHAGANPQPSREVGDAAVQVIRDNPRLFSDEWYARVPEIGNDDGQAWMLLVFASGDSIRSELSLGFESEQGLCWVERIILPELNPDDLAPKPEHGPTSTEEIDVPVRRKQG